MAGGAPGNLSHLLLSQIGFVAAGSHPLGFSGGCSLVPQMG